MACKLHNIIIIARTEWHENLNEMMSVLLKQKQKSGNIQLRDTCSSNVGYDE